MWCDAPNELSTPSSSNLFLSGKLPKEKKKKRSKILDEMAKDLLTIFLHQRAKDEQINLQLPSARGPLSNYFPKPHSKTIVSYFQHNQLVINGRSEQKLGES